MANENKVQESVTQSGVGISDVTGDTNMINCPRPSTPRGQRRFDKKSDAQKKHANSVYERPAHKTWHKPETCNHQSCKSSRAKNG